MKKFLKVTAIIIGIAVLLVIAALASVPLWLPVDKIKTLLIDQVREATGRDVELKELKFNILKGLELRGFVMKESERYKKRPFIKDDEIILKYNLLALLKGDLVIDKFQMINPYVEIVREQGGRFNFTDIIEKQAAKKAAAKPAEEPGKKEETKPAADKKKKSSFIKNVYVTSVMVKNGNFVYADYSKPVATSAKIENFNFDMENLALTALKPTSIAMSCVAKYNNYVIPVSLKSKLSADLKNRKVELKIAPFSIAGIDTTGTITVKAGVQAEGNLTSVSNTKKMLEVLPEDLAQKIKDVSASIDVENNVKFAMNGPILTFKDTLKLSNGEASYKGQKAMEKLKAEFTISDKFNLKGSMSMLLAGQEVKVDIEGDNINNAEESAYNVDIYSPKFAIEYLMAMLPQKEKKAQAKASPTPKPKMTAAQKKAQAKKTKQAVKKIQSAKIPGIYMNLKADSIFYKTVHAGKTISNIRFVDKVLYAETSITAYEGKINNNIVVDVNKESYKIDATISGVNISPFIDDAIVILPKKEVKENQRTILDDMKGKVHGSLGMSAKFNGSTFIDPAHTIKGDGNFAVREGKLTSLQMQQQLAQAFALEFLKNDIDFDILGAEFVMAKGKIDVNNMKLEKGEKGRDGTIRAYGAGYVTVDNELDFTLKTDLNPKAGKELEDAMAARFGIKDASYAYNTDGWMPMDFRVYGTTANKKYDYSQDRLLKNVTRNLTKKAENVISKEVEKKAGEWMKQLFKK